MRIWLVPILASSRTSYEDSLSFLKMCFFLNSSHRDKTPSTVRL